MIFDQIWGADFNNRFARRPRLACWFIAKILQTNCKEFAKEAATNFQKMSNKTMQFNQQVPSAVWPILGAGGATASSRIRSRWQSLASICTRLQATATIVAAGRGSGLRWPATLKRVNLYPYLRWTPTHRGPYATIASTESLQHWVRPTSHTGSGGMRGALNNPCVR